MPELPEVETMRRDLESRLVGRTIERVRVPRSSVLVGSARALRSAAAGTRVLACRRHGKVLIVDLSGGVSVLIHPRMTGRVLVTDGKPRPDHARVVFELVDGQMWVYADVRALGKVELCRTDCVKESCCLARFGPDALDEGAVDSLPRRAGHRRVAIKTLLLDQSVLAGIGNIYASEVLFRARIDPAKPAVALTECEWRRLCEAVGRVLDEAIAARGTTFRDYVTGDGTPGGYAMSLAVYGREGEPCVRPGCPGLIRRITQQQRSTFYCPDCQLRGTSTKGA